MNPAPPAAPQITEMVMGKHESECMQIIKRELSRFIDKPLIFPTLALRGVNPGCDFIDGNKIMYKQHRINCMKTLAAMFHVSGFVNCHARIAAKIIAKHCGFHEKTAERCCRSLETAGAIYRKVTGGRYAVDESDLPQLTRKIMLWGLNPAILKTLKVWEIWKKLKEWKTALLDNIFVAPCLFRSRAWKNAEMKKNFNASKRPELPPPKKKTTRPPVSPERKAWSKWKSEIWVAAVKSGMGVESYLLQNLTAEDQRRWNTEPQ